MFKKVIYYLQFYNIESIFIRNISLWLINKENQSASLKTELFHQSTHVGQREECNSLKKEKKRKSYLKKLLSSNIFNSLLFIFLATNNNYHHLQSGKVDSQFIN